MEIQLWLHEQLHKWDHLPWSHFKSPLTQIEQLPSFLVGEGLFVLLSLLCFVHAWKTSKTHLALWISTFITGTANDAFFMFLPVVDNFWHAQACIMLSPRLPLYIPCVYNVFLYIATVSSWRLSQSALVEAALAGLIAEVIYAPYDIVGQKFLWWTWHSTDAAIKHRLGGAPIGSTEWVITFSFTFCYLWRYCVSRSWSSFSAIVFSLFLTTPLMLVQMTLINNIANPFRLGKALPNLNGLGLCIGIYLAIIMLQLCIKSNALRSSLNKTQDSILRLAIVLWAAGFIFISAAFDPQQHYSVGLHQKIGPCHSTTIDILGEPRSDFICKENTDVFTFAENCKEGDYWYGVQGTPHKFTESFVAIVGLLCCFGLLLVSLIHSVQADNEKKKD